MDTKICNTCNENLNIINFSIRSNTKNNRHNKCKKCTNISASKYRKNNKIIINGKQKIWYNDNGKIWKQNYDKMNRYRTREYEKKKYRTDNNYRIRKIMRTRLNKTFKGIKLSSSILEYLGIEYSLFVIWMKFQFDENMTWENYGKYWDIDHVFPCSKFNLECKTDIIKCFNWRNLQPLEKTRNYSKNNRIDYDMCINQIEKVTKFESLYLQYQVTKEI